MNPYPQFVRQIAGAIRDARQQPLGGFAPLPRPEIAPGAPSVLIFSPHPDDEVIIGGLALRLLREHGWRAVNVAVTQGSNKARQAGRWEELRQCCEHIGFELVATAPGGLEGIHPRNRSAQPEAWARSVEIIRALLEQHAPRVILFPHDDDWNGTHIGTHHLVVDALRALGPAFSCHTVETEFWGAMDTPNVLVELSEEELGDLITALSFHVGEVRRNPYHLLLPAWMMDNVRRGGELVGGQGAAPPSFLFGTNYRLRRWQDGGFQDVLSRGRFLPKGENLAALFP